MFLHHLASLPDQALAKEVYSIQKENENLPGLVTECNLYLSQLGIECSDPSIYSKCQWKKLIKTNIHAKNQSDILTQIQSYKKLEYESVSKEEYGMKSYLKTLSLSESRTFFAARSRMLKSVQINYKNNPEYIANNHKCFCLEDDHQSHLVSCRSYSHLRDGLDILGSDRDLAIYYQRVIRERENTDEGR